MTVKIFYWECRWRFFGVFFSHSEERVYVIFGSPKKCSRAIFSTKKFFLRKKGETKLGNGRSFKKSRTLHACLDEGHKSMVFWKGKKIGKCAWHNGRFVFLHSGPFSSQANPSRFFENVFCAPFQVGIKVLLRGVSPPYQKGDANSVIYKISTNPKNRVEIALIEGENISW